MEASASPTIADAVPVEADVNALRAWRQQCPELRALWDESKPATAWTGVTFGKAGGAHAGRVLRIILSAKGLTGEVPAALGALTVGPAPACPRPLACASLTRHGVWFNGRLKRRGFKVRLLTWRADLPGPTPRH